MRNFLKSTSALALVGFLAVSCGGSDGMSQSQSDIANDAPLAEMAAASDTAGEANEEMAEQSSTTTENSEEASVAPQIAYSYSIAYRLEAERIDEVQQAHIALCDALGTTRCRIDTMRRSSGDGNYSSASLALRVDAAAAREFGNQLDAAISEVGGESSDRTIQAEDLSRQIVDTEARIRAKQALADRLLTVIQTRAGTVGEVVAAERAFAQAQQELDSARTWLRQMRDRVAMSTITISYQSYRPESGFFSPVRDSFSSSSQLLGMSIAAVIGFVVLAFPWAILLALIIWLVRRGGDAGSFFRRLYRKDPPDVEYAESDEE